MPMTAGCRVLPVRAAQTETQEQFRARAPAMGTQARLPGLSVGHRVSGDRPSGRPILASSSRKIMIPSVVWAATRLPFASTLIT
jgi:hypothetical protein